MAQVSGTTDTYDLVGIAEDVENIIYNISPTDTPLLTMAKRTKVTNTNHQWQTDSLASVAANRQIEGDDASYTTASPTTMLSNRTQISRKTMLISRTADRVRKYGRDSELARLTVKYGKELKRDIEYALVTNQASSAGGSSTARSSAGLESMITTNAKKMSANSGASFGGYSSGDWLAPVDGSSTGTGSTIDEATFKSMLAAVWTSGGSSDVLMTNTYQKGQIASFTGAAKFAGSYADQSRTQQGIIVAGVDMYISDYGEHRIKLNRYMRQTVILAIDPEYVSVGWLDPIHMEELAKTGDAEKRMLICEYTLIAGNPDAHGKLVDLYHT